MTELGFRSTKGRLAEFEPDSAADWLRARAGREHDHTKLTAKTREIGQNDRATPDHSDPWESAQPAVDASETLRRDEGAG